MGETAKVSAADRPLVFLDVETTGLDPAIHEIIEIAAVRVTPWGERVYAFDTKTLPTHIETASEEALRVNGYTPERWKDAVPLRFALVRFAMMFEGTVAPIVGGHNPRFDLGFTTAGFGLVGLEPPAIHHHIIDTSTLAWPLAVAGRLDSLSLGPLCELLGVSNDGAHGARVDVERCIAAYSRLVPWRERALVAPELRALQ